MLNREEIERIAKERGDQAKIIEKDYLLEIILFLLQEYEKNLVFKGGTALYKLYSLNRFSEDLDFTLIKKIDAEKLTRMIMKKLKQIGVLGRIKETSLYRNQQNIRFELRGPLFDGNPNTTNLITINISVKEKPIYKPKEERIYPIYRDIPSFTLQVMPIEEIFAEKIRALFTRNKPRDVYDIWFLIKKRSNINIQDINKKLKLYKEKFNEKRFIDKIEEKRKSWNMDLKGLIKENLPDFNIIKKEIIENINFISQNSSPQE